MEAQLVEKTCEPCRGGIPPLGRDEAEKLREQVPEWSLDETASTISRTYRFKNFAEAFTFVGQVAEEAEAQGHHPDVCFGWGYVSISLQTKKIKGLHENDFIMAAKYDRFAAGRT